VTKESLFFLQAKLSFMQKI